MHLYAHISGDSVPISQRKSNLFFNDWNSEVTSYSAVMLLMMLRSDRVIPDIARYRSKTLNKKTVQHHADDDILTEQCFPRAHR